MMFGINTIALLNNSDKLLQVYPELTEVVDGVKNSIAREKNCIPCARKKHARRILTAIFRIKYDGRDLSLLKDFMSDEGIKNIKQNI